MSEAAYMLIGGACVFFGVIMGYWIAGLGKGKDK